MTRSSVRAFALLPAVWAGWAGAAPEPGAEPAAIASIDQAVASAAAHVRTCYRDPHIPWAGRSIVTWLQVRYGPEGALGSWQVVRQEGVNEANRPYAEAVAQAATRAVIACSPLHLPPALYRGGWDAFELGFAFSVRV